MKLAGKHNKFLIGVILTIMALSVRSYAEQYLYRYVNDKGVKEVAHSVPPQYTQNGYEVLTLSGQLIKVVEPAPTNDQIAKAEAKRAIREQYVVLKRRYSTIEDIEAAKRRRLNNLDTNIAILRGNINGATTHIEGLMSRAADAERSGREVPKMILSELTDAKAELAVVKELLDIRLKEYQDISNKYDNDLTAFVKGQAMNAK